MGTNCYQSLVAIYPDDLDSHDWLSYTPPILTLKSKFPDVTLFRKAPQRSIYKWMHW